MFGSSKTDSSQLASSRSFTEEEVKKFERWYEEGYDLFDTDDRYIEWLKVYHKHPVRSSSALETSVSNLNIQDLSEINGTTTTSYSSSPVEFRATISEFLQVPTPPACRVEAKKCGKARVITSADFMEEMERKEAENKLKRLKKQAKKEQQRLKKLESERKLLNSKRNYKVP